MSSFEGINVSYDLIIFIDSEVWPNLIFEIKKRKTPIALINGRITKKTFNKWMWVSNFAKKICERRKNEIAKKQCISPCISFV